MRAAVVLDNGVRIPADVGELEAFRRWARSEDFPETGRIDFLEGTIELEMSPEELQTHGVLKTKLVIYVGRVVEEEDLGQVFVDRARLSSGVAGLSCEPDVVFVSLEALDSGRVRYLPPQTGSKRLIEIEGAATLAVEVISDSSVAKDTKRLPDLYARAGVEELWLADARSKLVFQIFHLNGQAYKPAEADLEGFQYSRVLARWLRLRREPWKLPNTWRYLIDER